MSNEFKDILKSLDTEDLDLIKLADWTTHLCLSKSGFGSEEAIKELQEKVASYEADFRTCENVPFCELLLSSAYWCWGDLPYAAWHADRAAAQFTLCGNPWNYGLSLWSRAFIYEENHMDRAVTEYKSAYAIFSDIAEKVKRGEFTDKYKSSQNKAAHLAQKIRELEERVPAESVRYTDPDRRPKPATEQTDKKTKEEEQASAESIPPTHPGNKPEPAPAPKKGKPRLLPTSHLVYRVGNFGHTNPAPVFDSRDDQDIDLSIETIRFDGDIYEIFNPRRTGDQIRLTFSGNYRWLKVFGTSMNRADPVSIEEDDFVLARLDQQPNFNDIVVANLHNPPVPGEKAVIIKRFTLFGLKSESSKPFDLVPSVEADIRGVVIAVAKPA